MTSTANILAILRSLLVDSGYEVSEEVRFENARFDLVAEDDTRLVFFEVKDSNIGWLDSFYDRQSVIETALSQVPIGRKWRDVYYVQVVSDPIDTIEESRAKSEIEGNTRAVRKLVVELPGFVDVTPTRLHTSLGPLLTGLRTPPKRSDQDVLEALKSSLIDQGFQPSIIEELVSSFEDPSHSCLDSIERSLNDSP